MSTTIPGIQSMKIGVIAVKKVLAGVALAGVLTLSAGTVAAQAAPGYPASPPSAIGTLLPGEATTFSGSGFTPGETIDVTITLTSFVAGEPVRSLPTSTAVADAAGDFTTQLILGWEEGTYQLTATGQTSGVTVNNTVTGISSGPVMAADNPNDAKDGMIAGQDALAYTGIDAAGAAILSLLGVGVLGAGVGMVTVSRRRHGQPA
ncbi:peptidase [Arthrobacter sp.]|uniref:peptidase n=1 Tax=Arthrobacter sp. TaxID=1667 RepID=UPI0026DF4CA2|nr:peptidase [Arthrobacter sp.]MDO5753137.1 peptidase [Arthrobacter sp.]